MLTQSTRIVILTAHVQEKHPWIKPVKAHQYRFGQNSTKNMIVMAAWHTTKTGRRPAWSVAAPRMGVQRTWPIEYAAHSAVATFAAAAVDMKSAR